ncbi:MAG TPA: hypothetical protein VGR95_14645 [Thermoanaerobaculia bacterium]|jgi:hypothetical protein|nr:hypothetical protein [Thermoanaerobaculia bacterium]
MTLAVPVHAGKRGAVAFHYARPLTEAQVAWLGQFDVLVTHDPLPRAQVEELHRRGTRLVLYEWAVAFYRSRGSFPAEALLNTRPLRGGVGAADIDAFYYDPATRLHAFQRPRRIAKRLKAIGYDGVFLDTTTHESVHPEALAEFRRRHPGVDYDQAFARFMRELRRQLKHGIVITNQGYRDAPDYLPFVDYDVTESLITWPHGGAFPERPWDDPKEEWNSIEPLMRRLIEPAMKSFPAVRFIHLNYTDDAAEIPRILEIAHRFGGEAFVAHPDVTAFESDVYFHAVP